RAARSLNLSDVSTACFEETAHGVGGVNVMDKIKRPRPNVHAASTQTGRAGDTRPPRPGVAPQQARVAQPKGARASANVRPPAPNAARPAAPPAYRPQPTPKVLQRKPAVAAAPPPPARRDGPPMAAPARHTRPK